MPRPKCPAGLDRASRRVLSGTCFAAFVGLRYYGYRWSDPVTGRWVSRDPIEEEGGLNLYGFADNNGVAEIDSVGLAVTVLPDGVVTSTTGQPCCAGLPYNPSTQCCGSFGVAEKVADDAGRKCCPTELREVLLKVDTSTNSGHVWLDLPDEFVQRTSKKKKLPFVERIQHEYGFYPDHDIGGCAGLFQWLTATVVHGGKIGNDAGRLFDRSKSYKACPQTVDVLRQEIGYDQIRERSGGLRWQIANDDALNCAGWACWKLSQAGLPHPNSIATRRLRPQWVR